jgi:hypothetical protein
MVTERKTLAGSWKYNVVLMGYPGPVQGWVGVNYRAAFGCPNSIVNDAARQLQGWKNAHPGLGTGLGSTLIDNGIVEPMELRHLPYRKGTYENYVGSRGLERQR